MTSIFTYAARALVGGLATAILITSSSAFAIIRVSVTPAIIEMQLKPGETADQVIYFYNKGTVPITVGTDVWDWIMGPNAEPVLTPAGADVNSMAAWCRIQPAQATVQPGRAAEFVMNVSVPRTARGGQYAYVYVGSARSSTSTGVGVAMRLPVRLLVDTGTSEPQVRVRVAQVRLPTQHQKLGIGIELKNIGDVHTWAQASADVLGPFGDFITSIAPEEQKALLLPNQTHRIELEWPGELSPASYEVLATVNYGDDRVALDSARFEVTAPAPQETVASTASAPAKAAVAGAAPPTSTPSKVVPPVSATLPVVTPQKTTAATDKSTARPKRPPNSKAKGRTRKR